MAPRHSSAHVTWDGPHSVSEVTDNLARWKRTVLTFPIGYHPAFSACLYNELRTRTRIDVTGDARLLERVAAIDGLHDLEKVSSRCIGLAPACEYAARRLISSSIRRRAGALRACNRSVSCNTANRGLHRTRAAVPCRSCGMVHTANARPPSTDSFLLGIPSQN
jgi:hypothetical protein